ncbi:hypothetical protein ACO2Q3_03645 [Caulobacter sp. KR2-114]|uniref:hypothetical protein n=1 Tax=Caulobacter sp. KR2-114 TaxID=3400912 RepID=UPI003C0AD582
MPARTLSLRKPQTKTLTIVLALACGAGLALTAPHARAQDQIPASVAPGAPSPDAVPTQDQITERMDRAEHRINTGVDDGSLTRAEAHRVLEQLANIKTQTNELVTRDGSLTPTDAQFINDRLNTLSHQIHWAKNNDSYRW